MPTNKQLKKLKKRLHTFSGEDIARYLIEYRQRTDLAPDNPVVKLMDLHQQWESGEDTREAMQNLIRDTNQKWGFHREFTTGITPHGIEVTENYVHNGQASPDLLAEWNRCLVLLTKGIFRIRKCAKPDCQQLFFGRFTHSAFHSEECRIAAEAESFRESRRDHMRELRRARAAAK